MRIGILAVFLLVFMQVVCQAELVDRVVAVVNADVITLSEVNEAGKEIFQRIAEQVPAEQREEALQKARENIISSLVDRKILLQEAGKREISVSDSDVDAALARILEDNKTSKAQFHQELGVMGVTEKQFKENLRDQILSSRLVGQEVHSKVIVPEAKIIDYYDAHYTEQVAAGGFYLLQIGLQYEAGASAASPALSQKASRIRDLARSGKDFKELARQYSDLPSATDGGDIGVFQADEMAKSMRDAVTGLKPGEISEIVAMPDSLQFFKLLSSQDGEIVTKVPYESVKEEIQQKLYQEEMQDRYKDWMKTMRDQAYIKIL